MASNTGDLPIPVTVEPKWDESRKMKALTWQGKEKVELVDHAVPDITDPSDIVIKVTGTTVCGSDLHLYHGEPFELYKGDILGHECTGIIEKVGPEVKKHKVGDHVVLAAVIACGQCKYCKQELYSACSNTNPSKTMKAMYGQNLAGIFGYGHITGGYPGCQAEYVRCPFADVNACTIPQDLPYEKALYLSDVVVTSYHACRDLDPQPGETIGIWGLGPIGLLICQWLKNVFKAGRIIGIDCVPERLDLAHRQWGVETLDFNKYPNVPERVFEMVPDGLDRAVDAAAFRYEKTVGQRIKRGAGLETDTSDNLNEAIISTKKFGSIAIIADYVGYTDGFNIGGLMEKGIRMIGCSQNPGQKYWETCMEHMRKGEFDPLAVVTHAFPLEKIEDVYVRFDKKMGGIIKTFLQTRFSPKRVAGPPLQDDVWADCPK